MSVRDGFKVLTHDYRPPVQGGSPVWDGKRKTLDKVTLDTGPDECAAGWNYCANAETALRIAGLWPDGRPSVLLRVRGSADAVERGDKRRCSRLTIVAVCDEDEVRAAVRHLSEPFGEHRERMVGSQMNWRQALRRPVRDEALVAAGLEAALSARGLDWKLCRYDDPRAARAARDARDAWDAWDAWDARAAWDAWAAWAARDAWDARDARAALTVEYAALQQWTRHDPLLLTTGLQDAYRNGLAIAMPTGPSELGWAMIDA